MQKKIIHESLKGTHRAENQDNLLIIEEKDYMLLSVFDGVGGASNGKKAADFCCMYIKNKYKHFYKDGYFDISNLMYETNKYLTSHKYSGLYTTYCFAFISYSDTNKLFYSSMGDSRIYAISTQYIEQITLDDKSEFGPKNIISKCLGMSDLTKNDFIQQESLISENKILLCTDGFYNLLEEDPLIFFTTINKKSTSLIKKGLSSLTNNRNTDDSTFILIQ